MIFLESDCLKFLQLLIEIQKSFTKFCFEVYKIDLLSYLSNIIKLIIYQLLDIESIFKSSIFK